jgi:hypothetical protein
MQQIITHRNRPSPRIRRWRSRAPCRR